MIPVSREHSGQMPASASRLYYCLHLAPLQSTQWEKEVILVNGVSYTRLEMGPLLRGQTVSVKGTADSEVQLCLGISATDPATLQSGLCMYSHSKDFALLLPLAHSTLLRHSGNFISVSLLGGCIRMMLPFPLESNVYKRQEFECFLLDP